MDYACKEVYAVPGLGFGVVHAGWFMSRAGLVMRGGACAIVPANVLRSSSVVVKFERAR